MDHAALRELAAGAALDDLDPVEREALHGHLATCGPCRRLADELHDVIAELALAAPPLHPPADLREHVLLALRDPSGPTLTVVPGGLGTDDGRDAGNVAREAGRRPARHARRWGGLAAVAVLAIAVAGLGVHDRQLADELASTQRELTDARLALEERQAVVAVAADPDHVTVPLHAEPVAPAARAVVMFRPGTSEAWLMATHLPATPDGRVYQLWYADGAGVHPLRTFHFDGQGPFVAPFGVDLATGAAAMVTLEPEGGARGTPGPQVVFGEF